MLFGTEERQKDILTHANEYANNNGMKLIFGAMVGSVSKGLQYADSDYDTRFLYLRNDFPDNICIPSQMREEELVKRYYFSGKVYEWIPFWEMTSFLQFLKEPSLYNDFSVGLYNIVGWTFKSPYIWDPYGLQNKLVPLIDSIFIPQYEIEYHKKIIDKYRTEFGKEYVITKSYLYAIHAAATIEWSIVYNMNPPIDLQALLMGLKHNDVWEEVRIMLKNARILVRKDAASSGDVLLHGAHFNVKTSKNELVEEYIDKMYSLQVECREINETIYNETINNMYKIIYRSVYENEELLF